MQGPAKRLAWVTVVSGWLLATAAHAALHDRGGGLIYDDVLDVTWLQDANYSKTSGYALTGRMSWDQATTWAENLSYFDPVRSQSLTGWRLPLVLDTGGPGCSFAYSGTDCGFNVQTTGDGTVYSELASLFYDSLSLKAIWGPQGRPQPPFENVPQPGWGRGNTGPFQNVQILGASYWTGTAAGASQAWQFDFYSGQQGVLPTNDFAFHAYAWAVRPGDVGPVPEPSTYALIVAGLVAVGLLANRRRTAASTSRRERRAACRRRASAGPA
jgi:hypothetical protein